MISIASIFSGLTIPICILGVVAGIIFGFLPGLSATMGVALLLPFTFGMETVDSFALLLGVYVGGIYGGSITAILIRTPGTPAAAATVLDGYPMAQQGKAKQALSIATFSSLLGGLFSCVILVFLSQVLARFALRFGAPEYFAVGIFGLSMVTALSRKALAKGIASVLIGFLLSTVGLDLLTAVPRFTLGNVNMLAGIEIVTALVGLFAVSEIFSKVEDVRSEKGYGEVKALAGKIIWPLRLIKMYSLNLLRSSIIGTAVGIIPATGAGTASWISYNEAIRVSKDKESFGKGNPDGIVASEAANNAVTGGALVPLLALGVPGDTVTAVMLGAMMIQGLTPGPMLFVNHADVVSGIYVLMVIANIIMAIVGIAGVRFFLKVLNVPTNVLMPCVLALCCVGACAVRGYTFDIQCALVLGIVGYLFAKTDYPTPPMLLGLILGQTIESNFRRAMSQSFGDWTVFFTRPISCVLLIVAICAFMWPIVMYWIDTLKARKKSAAESIAEAATAAMDVADAKERTEE
ncbi:MAG: C4-dicarboxylate ABC transporter permease [Clostridiales bacterium]|nr:C4-dicarboxylate ABC transporter permease [Clostridiales bacterium]